MPGCPPGRPASEPALARRVSDRFPRLLATRLDPRLLQEPFWDHGEGWRRRTARRSLGARIGGFGNRAGSDKSSAWESLLGEALSAFCQKFTGPDERPAAWLKLDHSPLSRDDFGTAAAKVV